MKTLSISLYRRPDYTSIMLDNLDKCYNIDEYHILICCEPSDKEVIDLARKFRPGQTTLKINPKKLGCNENIFQCLSYGFKNSNYHIHLEDDTVPSKDFLLYCEWANRFENDNSILSVCGYSKLNSDQYNIVSKRQGYNCWGWASWKSRWHKIGMNLRKELDKQLLHKNRSLTDRAWDGIIRTQNYPSYELYPLVSRIQNIGAENGTYCPNKEHHLKNQYNEYWIETTQNYQQTFEYI